MSDESSPETRSPFSVATDEFASLFGGEDLTEGRIRSKVSGLVEQALPVTTTAERDFRSKLIDNWSARSVVITDGIVIDRPDPQADMQRKLHLLCDAVGFFVGSPNSALQLSQKQQLIAIAIAQLHRMTGAPSEESRQYLGNALAPYVVASADRVEMTAGADKGRNIAMGREILSHMDGYHLLPKKRLNGFRQMLNNIR